MLAACWAQEGEWSEDAEDLGELNTKITLTKLQGIKRQIGYHANWALNTVKF